MSERESARLGMKDSDRSMGGSSDAGLLTILIDTSFTTSFARRSHHGGIGCLDY